MTMSLSYAIVTTRMASSGRAPAAFADIGSEYSTNGLLGSNEICLSARELHRIRNAGHVGRLPLVKEEKKKDGVDLPSFAKGTRHGATQPARSYKRIEERAKHLIEEEASGIEFEKLEALAQQRKREALVERAEGLMLTNTDECRALRVGLMRSDWLMALKEQEIWKERLNELERKREEHNRQLREQHNTIAVEREHHGKLRLQEVTQELKRSRLQHLQENEAKRESEKAGLAQEASQLKARIEQEKFSAAREEHQTCTRQNQTHAEALVLLSRTTEEKVKNASKRQDEADAEALLVTKRAEKLRLLEAQMREMRQRQIGLYSSLPMSQPAESEANEKARLLEDAEQNERSRALHERTFQLKKAEQHRAMADERLCQHQLKMDAQAKIGREDAAFAERWREETSQALVEDTLKKAERREAFTKVADFQRQQMAELKEKKRRKREDEKNGAKAALSNLEKNDEAVDVFRLRCIQNALKNGNPHWPLVRTLSKYSTSSGKKHYNNAGERTFSDDSGEECHKGG